MELPKYLIRPSDLAIFILQENELYANSKDAGRDYLYDSYSCESLLDLGFREPTEEEIEAFEYDEEVYMFTSEKFEDIMQKEIEKSTWDVGLPMVYMNEFFQLVRHFKDGTIEIIKNLKNK